MIKKKSAVIKKTKPAPKKKAAVTGSRKAMSVAAKKAPAKKTAAKKVVKAKPTKKVRPANPSYADVSIAKESAKTGPAKAAVAKTAPAKTAAAKTVAKVPANKNAAARVSTGKAKATAKRRESGIPELMRDDAIRILDERQAEQVITIDLVGRSSVADYLIVASGRSARQISAMAHYLREAFVGRGVKNIRVEGAREGNWALVDGGDVIVHLFRPEVRTYYDLEAIWDKKAGNSNDPEEEV